MAKRVSQEARIVAWFETAPVLVMEVVFGIVQAVVKRRKFTELPNKQPAATAMMPRKPRKKRESL